MQSTIIHLLGSPGVGKYTIGRRVAEMTGARLVDNHSVANVIFNLLPVDGVTPLPAGVWGPVGRVRDAVLETLASLSPREMSFVFTNFAREDEEDHRAIDEMVAIADARGSVFVPVLLHCETAELVRRIVSPDRRERMKLVDPVLGARLNGLPPFQLSHPNWLGLDVTSSTPDASAAAIVDWAERCTGPA